MKHSLPITVVLLAMFLLAQFIGLGIVYKYIDPVKSQETGETEFKDLPIGERPPVNEKTSFLPVILAILIGTGLLLILLRFRLMRLWKLWFLLAVVISLGVAWSVFLPSGVAFAAALVAGIWRLFRPNIIIQNLTELFIYGGLAAIFVPIFNLFSVSILLVLIALYDAYAVWKSKHMVTLAKSQMKQKMFAGLLIPYRLEGIARKKPHTKTSTHLSTLSAPSKVSSTKMRVRTAILGGGDIGFPLIFAGVVLKELGIWQSITIPFFAFAGLALLLWKADQKKFYPAMPFIGGGCFLGLGAIWLLSFVV